MIRKNYTVPVMKVVRVRQQPILEGSIPTSKKTATEWGAKGTSGGWFEEDTDEDE